MDREKIREFFDSLAEGWDTGDTVNAGVVNAMLDMTGDIRGKKVLDVGAGTGVLVPFLLERGAEAVRECDISHGMLEVNRRKFDGEDRVSWTEGDASELLFGTRFDLVIIWDALPHFTDRNALFRNLISHLREGGTLTVAHSMTSAELDLHHRGISTELWSSSTRAEGLAGELRGMLSSLVWQDEPWYFVSGRKLQD